MLPGIAPFQKKKRKLKLGSSSIFNHNCYIFICKYIYFNFFSIETYLPLIDLFPPFSLSTDQKTASQQTTELCPLNAKWRLFSSCNLCHASRMGISLPSLQGMICVLRSPSGQVITWLFQAKSNPKKILGFCKIGKKLNRWYGFIHVFLRNFRSCQKMDVNGT